MIWVKEAKEMSHPRFREKKREREKDSYLHLALLLSGQMRTGWVSPALKALSWGVVSQLASINLVTNEANENVEKGYRQQKTADYLINNVLVFSFLSPLSLFFPFPRNLPFWMQSEPHATYVRFVFKDENFKLYKLREHMRTSSIRHSTGRVEWEGTTISI